MATTAATGIDVSEFAEFAVSLDDVELKQVCSGVCVTLPKRRLLVPPTCQHHRYCRNAIVPRPVAVCHFYLRLFWHPRRYYHFAGTAAATPPIPRPTANDNVRNRPVPSRRPSARSARRARML